MRPRIALVCLITAALLAAAAWAGAGGLLLSADRVYAIPVIAALVLLGIGFGWFFRWDMVEKIGDKLPAVGLVLTVLGVVLAVSGVTVIDDNTRMAVFRGVGESLVANLVGMVGYIWLWLLREVCE